MKLAFSARILSLATTQSVVSATKRLRALAIVATLAAAAGCSTKLEEQKFFQLAPKPISYPSVDSYSPRLSAIKTLTPSSEQTGNPTLFHYSISPTLPNGLSIDEHSGTISGTPDQAFGPADFTVTLKNQSGSVTAKVKLGATAIAPKSVTYSKASLFLIAGETLAPLAPTLDSASDPVTYQISPSISDLHSKTGLDFDTSSGVISGSATAAINAPVSYKITATNSGGSVSTTIQIDIHPVVSVSVDHALIQVGDQSVFTATGGYSPFAFSISTSTPVGPLGSVDATGKFTATAEGSVTIQATDPYSHSSTKTITVNPKLAASIQYSLIQIGDTDQLTATGGVPPYAYSATPTSVGTISASGLYTSLTTGSPKLTVTDALAHVQDVQITVNPKIAVTAQYPKIQVGDADQLTTTGGVPPYSFSVTPSSAGSVDSSGKFTASSTGAATLTATDARGHTANAAVTVNAALTATIKYSQIQIGDTDALTVAGGVAPYTYSVTPSDAGSFDANGVFTAAVAEKATIKVGDTLKHSVSIDVTITAKLALSAQRPAIQIGDVDDVTATGGILPYKYSVSPSNVGSVDANGRFTGAEKGIATVTVTDARSHTATAPITVVDVLKLSSQYSTIQVGDTNLFTPTGGIGPYTYAVSPSASGSMNADGLLTATQTGNLTATVTDALKHTATASVLVVTPLTADLAYDTIQIGDTDTLTASGGVLPYSYSVTPSTAGAIDSHGVFTAADAGAATLKVTDVQKHSVTANVMVNAKLTVVPSANPIFVGATDPMTVAGGISPYHFVATGPATISDLGVLTATGPGTSEITVTDARSHTAKASITIRSAITLSVDRSEIAVGNTAKFTVKNAVGSYSFKTNSADTISPEGVLTAVAAGSPTVTVTDSVNQTFSLQIKIDSKLELTAPKNRVMMSKTLQSTATGGVPPLVYSVNSNGSINSSTGLFTASSVGSPTIKVTDALANTATLAVTVYDVLKLSALPSSLREGEKTTFNGTGGFGSLSITATGPGTFNSSTRQFSSNAPGTINAQVLDADGNSIPLDVSVSGTSAMGVTPASSTIAVGMTLDLQSSGGLGTYAWSVDSVIPTNGSGTIQSLDATHARLTATAAGIVKVTATDGLKSASATITINPALSISLAESLIQVGDTDQATASGGLGAITYSISGNGTINASTGLVTATQSGSATVTARDTNGHSVTASLTIHEALASAAAHAVVQAGDTDALTTTGGVGSYHYSASGPATVNGSGLVTTSAAGTAIVTVTDDRGHQKTVTIQIEPVLALSAAQPIIQVDDTDAMTATGGVAPYHYEISANGTVNNQGLVTATSMGSATITVTDSLAHHINVTITIHSKLSISAPQPVIQVGDTDQMTVSGGVGPFAYSTTGNGTISQSGLFTATSAGSPIISVTDALNHKMSFTLSVQPALNLSAASALVDVLDTDQFTATGGVPPYSFTTTGNGSISTTGLFTASSVGTPTIQVADSLGHKKTVAIRVRLRAPEVQFGTLALTKGGPNLASTLSGQSFTQKTKSVDPTYFSQFINDPEFTSDNGILVFKRTIPFPRSFDPNAAVRPQVTILINGWSWDSNCGGTQQPRMGTRAVNVTATSFDLIVEFKQDGCEGWYRLYNNLNWVAVGAANPALPVAPKQIVELGKYVTGMSKVYDQGWSNNHTFKLNKAFASAPAILTAIASASMSTGCGNNGGYSTYIEAPTAVSATGFNVKYGGYGNDHGGGCGDTALNEIGYVAIGPPALNTTASSNVAAGMFVNDQHLANQRLAKLISPANNTTYRPQAVINWQYVFPTGWWSFNHGGGSSAEMKDTMYAPSYDANGASINYLYPGDTNNFMPFTSFITVED